MDFGTLLLMLGLSYALGVLWYDLLPGELPGRVWRVAAYPFLGIFIAHTLLQPAFSADPAFGGLHLITTVIGSLVAVVVDWVITRARRPSLVTEPELRRAPATS
ncbi:MAG: hypothetical protein K6U89_10580 [Chloroflexi bacterium]|nr:hypothetical protein [Chloroflexota bacterium]GIW11736.1 MAG: hypothetical protein KatS3mg061_2793 [Dehalococcoidia bacterium]